MQIGNKMRQRREQLKWSQEYVAEKLNMSPSNYSKYESDKIKPSAEIAIDIAKILEMDLRELLPESKLVVFEKIDKIDIEYNQTGNNSTISVVPDSKYEREMHKKQCELYEDRINYLLKELEKSQK